MEGSNEMNDKELDKLQKRASRTRRKTVQVDAILIQQMIAEIHDLRIGLKSKDASDKLLSDLDAARKGSK